MKARNIHRVSYKDKEITLIGIDYIFQKSTKEIKEIIETERPDSVCVELDAQRYYIITDKQRWQNTDIIQILKTKKLIFLLIDLILSSFKKRVERQFGNQSEQGIIQAIDSAKKIESVLVLVDRDIRITFRRVWRRVGIKGKISLLIESTLGLFNRNPITEEELEQFRKEGIIAVVLKKFAKSYPRVKKVFVDERDQFLSQKIKEAPGRKIIVVVGSEHIPGIKEEIYKEQDIEMLSNVPARSRLLLMFALLIPIFIIGTIGSTFTISHSAGVQQMSSWVLWNGILSSIGAAAGIAHPITILITFFSAPIAALLPLISTSGVVLLVETLIRRPTVGDFEKLTKGKFTIKGLWKNRVTRILLAAGFANVGSIVGSLLSSTKIIQLFIKIKMR